MFVSTLRVDAQRYDCTFKDPLLHIDFGSAIKPTNTNTGYLPQYFKVSNDCPLDGSYAYVDKTNECFNGDWFTLSEDHTPGDVNGKMMLVNANESGGVFFTTTITGLSAYKTYEFAAWMMNICKLNGGCTPLPPNIVITITSSAGRRVGVYEIGRLSQGNEPHWRKYVGYFFTGPNESTLQLTMEDNTIGGCGNDFALDDITIRECRTPVPPLAIQSKPVPAKVITKPPVAKTPVAKKEVATKAPVKKEIIDTENTLRSTPITSAPSGERRSATAFNIPAPILGRTNTLIRRIETEAAEIQIDLYDNGQIDGDTVSIYQNNELIVSRAGLSAKAVTIRVTVDKLHPHHEFIMVANNLGSIPPNTSLMVVTANDKRYEVFISSSEEKNAKVVIDLKE
jgi:hypothetical protein